MVNKFWYVQTTVDGCRKSSSYLLENCQEYKSDGGLDSTVTPLSQQLSPMYLNGKSRDRVGAGGESRMPEGRGNSSPEQLWMVNFGGRLYKVTTLVVTQHKLINACTSD